MLRNYIFCSSFATVSDVAKCVFVRRVNCLTAKLKQTVSKRASWRRAFGQAGAVGDLVLARVASMASNGAFAVQLCLLFMGKESDM